GDGRPCRDRAADSGIGAMSRAMSGAMSGAIGGAIAIVVGTRPEIIKMAPIVRACVDLGEPFLLLHTGQHYSFEMDGVFFRELELPAPPRNLEVRPGSPADHTA